MINSLACFSHRTTSVIMKVKESIDNIFPDLQSHRNDELIRPMNDVYSWVPKIERCIDKCTYTHCHKDVDGCSNIILHIIYIYIYKCRIVIEYTMHRYLKKIGGYFLEAQDFRLQKTPMVAQTQLSKFADMLPGYKGLLLQRMQAPIDP